MSGLTAEERRRRRQESLLLPKNGVPTLLREPVRTHPRLAIYGRLSQQTDASVSIARQRESLERHVRELGGVYDPQVDYFQDDDVSAKGTAYRDGAERLLRAIMDNRYDGVVVWEFARFMRNRREARTAFQLMEEHATELYSVSEPYLTLYGPGRVVLEFALDQAEKELLKISGRVTAAHAYLARFGPAPPVAPTGTRKVAIPFPDGVRAKPIHRLEPDDEPRPELGGRSWAGLVRQAARDVIAGRSCRSIVGEWGQAGVLTPRGKKWASSNLTDLLRNPLLAGYATFHQEVLLDEAGQPMRVHTPLLDDATWTDLCAAFAQRPVRARSAAEAPLRGLLRCSQCGSSMTRNGKDPKLAVYRCWRDDATGSRSCKNKISAGRTERLVVEAAIGVLSDPARLAEVHGTRSRRDATRYDQLGAEATKLRSALERLDLERALGEYDDLDGPRRYERVKARLLEQLAGVLTEQRRAHRPRPLSVVSAGVSPAEAFERAAHHERLTVLHELIEHVIVTPWVDRGQQRRFDPTRVSIVWHQDEL